MTDAQYDHGHGVKFTFLICSFFIFIFFKFNLFWFQVILGVKFDIKFYQMKDSTF